MGLYTKAVVESLNQDDGQWQIKDIGKIFTVPKSYQPHNGEFTEFPFSYQNYAISAFIADLRNRYGLTPIMEYRPLPDNHELLSAQDPFGKSDHFSDYPSEFLDESSKRWTLVSELLSFDYDTTFRDLSNNDQITTYRDILGEQYFLDLKVLEGLGDPDKTRVIWAFY
ncbi:TPA: hypothetical protein ACPVZG_000493 [Vibrio parahaemolyticus]